MNRKAVAAMLAILGVLGAACSSAEETPDEIVLMTHGSFAVSEGVLEAFTSESGVAVTVLESADAGTIFFRHSFHHALDRRVDQYDLPVCLHPRLGDSGR